MKLSDIKGERTLDVIAEIIDPVANIAEDKAASDLFQKKNLTVFILFSVYCFGCLGLMGDFGTAIIFFVTFLIISFLRSGDFSKLVLMVGAAAAGGAGSADYPVHLPPRHRRRNPGCHHAGESPVEDRGADEGLRSLYPADPPAHLLRVRSYQRGQ